MASLITYAIRSLSTGDIVTKYGKPADAAEAGKLAQRYAEGNPGHVYVVEETEVTVTGGFSGYRQANGVVKLITLDHEQAHAALYEAAPEPSVADAA